MPSWACEPRKAEEKDRLKAVWGKDLLTLRLPGMWECAAWLPVR